MERIILLIARDAHSNRTKEEIESDVDDIIEFETKFAQITVESAQSGNFSTAFRASRLSDMSFFLPKVSSVGKLNLNAI
jgi:hypothetical protein